MPRRVARALLSAWDEPPGLGGMERGDSVSGGAEPGERRSVRGNCEGCGLVVGWLLGGKREKEVRAI